MDGIAIVEGQIAMIYNFYYHYFWVKGGVEAGMAHRAKIFRKLGLDAKFIFSTTFHERNIQHEIASLGFLDSEVIWLYSFFTDCKISPVTYSLKQLEGTFEEKNYIFSRDENVVKYQFPDLNVYYLVFMTNEKSNLVHRVVMISNGCIVRKDYYTYCRIYSEYYVPVCGQAHLYLRRFFNEDGSIAYEEIIEDDVVLYKFTDRMLYSREELVEYMISCLHITRNDVVLIEGEWGVIERAAFIQNIFPTPIGVIIHTNHFQNSDGEHILWSQWFEYIFAHSEKINFFITSTEAQRNLLKEQFHYYKGIDIKVEAIPVAYLSKICIPEKVRKKHSLITAGRLHPDKYTNRIIEAAVMARKRIPDLILDIYGEGEEEEKLQELIDELCCSDYIHLCGFQKLDNIYQNYEAYVSASKGETFGITLLEATGSGLAIVGYDCPYGMQSFVDEGENGFKISEISSKGLAEGIIRLFTEANLEKFREHSYEKAKAYLESEVAKKWEEILKY